MKIFNLFVIAAALFGAVLLPACSVKDDFYSADEGEGVVLTFYSDESFLTKAKSGKAGEDAYNENVLNSVEYFLYSEENKDGDAVLHGYLTSVSQNTAYSVPMTNDIVNYTLCPGNAKNFYVYAIANHDRIVADENDLSGTSVAELELLTKDLELDGGNIATPQSQFLMATPELVQSPAVKRRNTTVAAVTVNLKRVAAKITIAVRVVESVEIVNEVTISGVTDTRTEIWRPRTHEMSVYLVNGRSTGQISGDPLSTSDIFTYQSMEFDQSSGESHTYDEYSLIVDSEGEPVLDGNGDKQFQLITKTGTFYPGEHPFYTYPSSWEYGEEDEPYIKLVIPWDRDPGYSDSGTYYGATSKLYYYRIYCPADAIDAYHAQFVRNCWYKVILNVGILGSETDGGEMIIDGQYYVVDWQEREKGTGGDYEGENDTDKEAEIKGARYLFVNDTDYILYNLDDLMIPYVTSDVCEIVDFSGLKYDFSGSTKQPVNTTDKAAWNVTLDLVTTSTGAHIRFNHPLNNDTSTSNYDVSPYIFTFTVRHKDDPSYSKTITITQRPAIMIDMDNNEGGTHYGYTYVNGGTGTTYGTNGTSSGNNTNFNMFIIETTVLPSDSNYLLGDPRLTSIDNLNNWPTRNSAVSTWSADATSVQGSTRRLSYYYPVNDDASADNILAPKYRVASSHGATSTLSYQYAFRRCASYQEKGYPAGRWRLPTVAEVSYITKLNADGMIVRLFGSTTNGETTDYWCNSGYITVYDGTNAASKQAPVPHSGTSGQKYVRCVYDEWYWDGIEYNGNDYTTVTPLTTFKWGDIAR